MKAALSAMLPSAASLARHTLRSALNVAIGKQGITVDPVAVVAIPRSVSRRCR